MLDDDKDFDFGMNRRNRGKKVIFSDLRRQGGSCLGRFGCSATQICGGQNPKLTRSVEFDKISRGRIWEANKSVYDVRKGYEGKTAIDSG